MLINFWCVNIFSSLSCIIAHFQKLLYLVVVRNLFEVNGLARLVGCSTDISLILLALGHIKLQLIRLHRIRIRLKSYFVQFIRHARSRSPVISFSADCRFCKQICWKLFLGLIIVLKFCHFGRILTLGLLLLSKFL